MLDTEATERAVAWAALFVLQAPLVLLLVGTALRFAGRVPGTRWAALLTLSVGASLGFGVVLFGDPLPMRIVTLVIISAGFIQLLWRDRRGLAGVFLLGAALPWTVLYGYLVAQLLLGAVAFEPFQTWTFFLLGLAPGAGGGLLALMGDPPPPDPDPSAPPGRPGSRQIGIVARSVVAPEALGPLPISELAAFIATVGVVLIVGAVAPGGPLEPVAQVALGALVGSEARILVRPGRARRAFEVFSWLGEWEFTRATSLTGRSVPATELAAAAWLDEVPDRPETRWLRVELLAWLRRFDDARTVAATMPDRTPYERFERAHADDVIDWMVGGDGDPEALHAAAAEIDDVDMRLRAEVAVAVRATARNAAERGFEHAAKPLGDLRDKLGQRADRQLRRALWRRSLPVSIGTAIVVVLLTTPFG